MSEGAVDPERHRRLGVLAARRAAFGPDAIADAAPEDIAEVEHMLAAGGTADESPLVDPAALASLAADLAADEDDAGPPIVPGHRLERRLGRGAHAEVWEAVETEGLMRSVALKILACPFGRCRFELERLILARLSHPNIARVHGAGTTADGRPYLAMELLHGRTFVDACRDSVVSVEARVELLVGAARGVQRAHERGILHRDLKPSNIVVVEEEGRTIAKVIDFGVAKVLDPAERDAASRTPPTAAGSVVGTPGYMAPEQLGIDPRGEGIVGVRSDVYALGAVLFEALVGRPRWELAGRSYAQAIRIVAEEPPLGFAASTTRVDRELAAIVERALEPDPERRFESAAAFADDLERWLRGEPIESRPASTFRRVRWYARRHRAATAVLGAVAFTVLGAGVLTGLLYAAERRENDRLRAWAAATLASTMQLADVVGSVEARDRMSALAVDQMRGLVDEGDPHILGLWSDALSRRSDVFRERGDVATARRLRIEALEAAERTAERAPLDAAARRRVARATVLIGDIDRESGRLDAAITRYRAAHAIYLELAAAHARDPFFEVPLVWSYDRVFAHASGGHEGEEAGRLASAMHRLAFGLDSSARPIETLQARIAARDKVILHGSLDGRSIDAAAMRSANLDDGRELVRLAPQNRVYRIQVAAQMSAAAARGVGCGPSDGPCALLYEAVTVLRPLVESDPSFLDGWAELSEIELQLALELEKADDALGAIAAAERAEAASRALANVENPYFRGVHLRARALCEAIRARSPTRSPTRSASAGS
jgi:tetratricopeptide (TPR) repeat protein